MKKNWWIILWVLAAVAAIVGLVLYTRQGGSDITITSDYVDGNRISTVGMFTVKGASDMDSEELAARLRFDPEMEFQTRKNPDGTFTLLTYRSLEPGKRVQIFLLSPTGGVQKTWEFQTADIFQVSSVFPADGATDVPPSSSIEVKFTFADLVDDDLLRQYITLSPELDFYCSVINNNLVIYAAGGEHFPAGTTIQVTLSADLPRKSGGTLGQDYTFSFTTGAEEDREYRVSSMDARVTENILPGDSVLLKLSMGREMHTADLTTTVYRYPDADAYVEALRSYRDAVTQRQYTTGNYGGIHDDWQVDVQGLEQVMEFTGPSVEVTDYSYERFVLLPDELEPGWYAATVEATMPSGGTVQASKLIQVSPLSVFTIQPSSVDREGGSSMLAWVNRSDTGAPVSGAQVKVSASAFQAEGTTGQDGLVTLSGVVDFFDRSGMDQEYGWTQSDRIVGLMEVRDGDEVFHELYGADNNSNFGEHRKENDYTGYLFTDRPVYRHTDTVKAWGLVRPWKEGVPLPGALYLSTGEEAFRHPLELREDGTFLTEFQLEAISGSGMWLGIVDGDDMEYFSLWIRLEDYVKPEYQTTSTLDRPVFTAWQDSGEGVGMVGMDFTAHYYEGTPARGYTAVAREPEDAYNTVSFTGQEVVTDEDGFARVILQPGEIGEYYQTEWRPQQITYGIFSTGELGAPQVEGGTFYYLTRDMMLQLEKGEDGATVTARVHQIDVSGIEDVANLLVEDNLRGAPADGVELAVEIHKEWYERTPDGERYDAINKTSVSAFRYEYMDEVVDTRTGVTADGVCTFTGLPTGGEGESFYVVVSLRDSRDEPVADRITYTDNLRYGYGDASHSFRLVRREDEDAVAVYAGDLYGQQFGDGETLDMYMTDNGVEFSDPDGSLLYVLAQDEILEYGTGAATTFQLPFSEDYLPNYSVAGAYFDGRHVYALTTAAMVFNPEARELDIDIQPQQERYGPGETATVSLRVTEKATGAAVADASLVAAVVDEAVFAIEEQNPAFLTKYYRQKSFSYLIKYTSYDNKFVDGGGMGGGGPNPFIPRVDFPDTAAFLELTTDSSGTATFTVDLPDNLTSWRVTALAMSQDNKMGDAKDNFAVGKDFFISPVLPPRLLVGDDLAITVHSAGMAVNPDDAVSYTAFIEGFDWAYTAAGKAGDYTPIALDGIPGGSLPEGEYSLTVTGEWNGTGDTVILPLSVVDSGVTLSVTERMSLDRAKGLDSKAWPVTLGFYDKDSELAVEILSHLYGQNGNRLDQQMARRYALERMAASGMDLAGIDTSAMYSDFREYAPDYAGYRLFPYSEPDQVLSVRANLMAPEYSSGGIVYGFEELPDDPTARAASYLYFADWEPGPARAEEIGEMLDHDLYSFGDKMYLVAALAVMGFEEEAADQYQRLSAPLRAEQADADGNPLVSMDGNSADTAAASMVVNLMGLPDAEGMARYLLTAPVTDEVYLLELMYYLQKNEDTHQGGKLSYTRDGAEEELDLQNGFVFRTFTKAQLTEAGFQAEGDIWVSAVYTAGLEQALSRDNGTLVMSEAVEPVQGGILRKGELAKITVRLEVPAGVTMDPKAQLKIQDYVPTGMRYESMEGGTGWYLVAKDDQRATFAAFRDEAKELVFYARCVTPGSYVVESVFGSTMSGSAWGATERRTIEILP